MNSKKKAPSGKKQTHIIDVETFHINKALESTNGLVMDSEHAHNYHEILFNFSSIPMKHTSNGYSHQTETPFILYRAPNILHSSNTLSDQTYSRYVLCFSSALLQEYAGICSLGFLANRWECLIPTSDECMERFKHLLVRLQRYKQENAPLSYIVALLSVLLYEINELIPQSLPEEKNVPLYIKEIIHYISSHLGDDLSINTLAKIFFVSRTKLIDDFYASTRINLHEYITSVRLSNAKIMIAKGVTLNIVAERCGYSQTASFLHMFRRETGMTPGKYRASLCK